MPAIQELRTVLDSVRDERLHLEERIETLKQREATLVAWIAEEEPSERTPQLPAMPKANGGTPLSAFLRTLLADGKPRTSAEIGELAKKRGLVDDDASPGRVVHFALCGLSQHGYVSRDRGKKTWKAAG